MCNAKICGYKVTLFCIIIDFPSIISASVHNSAVVDLDLYSIQYVFVFSVCSDIIASYLYTY